MNIIKKIANSLGYDLIKTKKHPSLNAHIINLIRFYKIDTVIDVGANNGQFGLSLRKNGYLGDIYSFEPVSTTFNRLKTTSEHDNNWHIYNTALGDKISSTVINVSESSDLSSILVANKYGQGMFPAIKISHQETIEIDTFDMFYAKYFSKNSRRILFKMDTQGYDLKVFRGAQGSFKNIFCLLSEVSLTPLYSDMPHYLETLREYEENGFHISGMYPVSRNKLDLSIIEFDCVLINKRQISQY